MRYVICALDHDENIGGAIWLHGLADELARLGEDACVCPIPRRRQPWRNRARSLRKAYLPFRVQRSAPFLARRAGFRMQPGTHAAPIAHHQLRDSDVVVYPEIVSGNPLGARHVVRWLLYKPSLQPGPFVTDPGDMFFAAGAFSDEPARTGGAPRLAYWKINPAYRNKGYATRSGSCYMLRKGKDKPIAHDLRNSVCLDGKSHAEIAEAFNRAEVFYCYDEMTLYSEFAALCGCPSVVIPGLFRDQAEYMAARKLARYGVAYGAENLDHARNTLHLVEGVLREREEENLETIRNFVTMTRERFAQGRPE